MDNEWEPLLEAIRYGNHLVETACSGTLTEETSESLYYFGLAILLVCTEGFFHGQR